MPFSAPCATYTRLAVIPRRASLPSERVSPSSARCAVHWRGFAQALRRPAQHDDAPALAERAQRVVKERHRAVRAGCCLRCRSRRRSARRACPCEPASAGSKRPVIRPWRLASGTHSPALSCATLVTPMLATRFASASSRCGSRPAPIATSAVELGLVRAIAAQYLGLRQAERAREARAERRIDEVQVRVVHLVVAPLATSEGSPCAGRRTCVSVHRVRRAGRASPDVFSAGRLRPQFQRLFERLLALLQVASMSKSAGKSSTFTTCAP